MGIQLDTPVQFIKGVGPKISALLARKDIHKVGDVLQWFPRSYEDRRAAKQISDLRPGQLVSFVGEILICRDIQMGRTRRRIYELVVKDATGRIACKWFRVPFKDYFKAFTPGSQVRVTGEVKNYRGVTEIHHPEVRLTEGDSEEVESGLLPIYSETEGLNQKLIRRIVGTVIGDAGGLVEETLPEWILKDFDLPPLNESLMKVHQPGEEDVTTWQQFRTPHHRRLIFEEFFWMELLLARSKVSAIKEKGFQMKPVAGLAQKIRADLPFKLTDGQESCLAEITGDLLKPHPMHRLVQGDVGCGKTIVSFLSAALVLDNGFQVAIMAPTEILAEQHFKKAQEIFSHLGIKLGFLSGGLKEKESQKMRDEVESGNIQLVIGTHALIQENVSFKNLGLVVIDEQHRFGVKQRAQLKQKGGHPHMLIMTATPIPRTLAMSVYGDLDVSVIKELPQGRIPITTRVVHDNKKKQVFDFVRDQIGKGRQAYVIYPLVEETEKMDLQNATDAAAQLTEELKPYTVGLVHGRLKPQEKEELMGRFKRGEIHVLVSTTVVEVGVDVPNATVMVIEHAERFGLAQLHQLRGRVGRGSHKSYCILISGYALSDEGKKRLSVMEQTQDGFRIAEEDLLIRGPGEFMGTRQSGLPGFRLANLVRDVELLALARKAAFKVIETDPELKKAENLKLKNAILQGRRPALLFAQIG
ncbi:MAG: ATP-dependent DNA helicase RecG [Oligoflexia bacterium]|nr:ATP-dependent DNA helicase RecG [Oligoflexia bacterium]